MKIKSIAEIAEKYGRVTPARESDYKSGVTASDVDWAGPTKAASSAWEDGVQTAIGNKSFDKGVDRAGNEKFKRKVAEVGVPRWGAGVRAGVPDYNKGFSPYRDTLESTSLSPRFKRGDTRNYIRSQEVGTALHDKKVRG